jgi:ubiquinone/menaquinone biosynthesis C-methylase UbiE
MTRPDARAFWNTEATTFDDAADHGLRDPALRTRWGQLLGRLLPPGGRVLDIGCGTGSLSVLLAQAGYQVTGIDFAPAMVERARAKAAAAGLDIAFAVGDAADPAFPAESFDIVLGRHILWAIPDIPTSTVLERWAALLRPGGRLVLIEGFWHTGAGLRQSAVLDALPENLTLISSEDIAAHRLLWGEMVTDERYAIRADKA